MRHQIEEVYYSDAGIRTIWVAGDRIDRHVAANLSQAFGYHRRQLTISSDQQHEIYEKFRAGLETGVPPLEIMMLLAGSGKVTSHDCRTILYRAIWNRQLRVDLYRPIMIDRPLNPEEKDVLVEFGDWFKEKTCR